MSMMARRRAQKRWSSLLTRIQNHVRLDDLLWSGFAAHTKQITMKPFLQHARGLSCIAQAQSVGFHADFCGPDVA